MRPVSHLPQPHLPAQGSLGHSQDVLSSFTAQLSGHRLSASDRLCECLYWKHPSWAPIAALSCHPLVQLGGMACPRNPSLPTVAVPWLSFLDHSSPGLSVQRPLQLVVGAKPVSL